MIVLVAGGEAMTSTNYEHEVNMAEATKTEKTSYQGQMHLLQKEIMGRYFDRLTRAAEQGEGKAAYMLISGNPV